MVRLLILLAALFIHSIATAQTEVEHERALRVHNRVRECLTYEVGILGGRPTSDSTLRRRDVFDRDGRMAESFSYGTAEKIVERRAYVYDASGRLERESVYDDEGYLTEETRYRYDSVRARLHIVETDEGGDTVGYTVRHFDGAGRDTVATTRARDRSFFVSARATYDGAGRYATRTLYARDGTITSDRIYERDTVARRLRLLERRGEQSRIDWEHRYDERDRLTLSTFMNAGAMFESGASGSSLVPISYTYAYGAGDLLVEETKRGRTLLQVLRFHYRRFED